MIVITTQNPVFGKGYFMGFDKDGLPHFQSCHDKRVKSYKNRKNAEKQLARIRYILVAIEDKATYFVEPAPNTRRHYAH